MWRSLRVPCLMSFRWYFSERGGKGHPCSHHPSSQYPAALWGDARPTPNYHPNLQAPAPNLGLPRTGTSPGPHLPWTKGNYLRPFRFDPLRSALFTVATSPGCGLSGVHQVSKKLQTHESCEKTNSGTKWLRLCICQVCFRIGRLDGSLLELASHYSVFLGRTLWGRDL